MTAAQSKLLFGLCLLLGCAIIWINPHPAMVDLPQHAGQLRLLHDLVTGQSPWAGLVEVNLWTPYLIAFGLALPLSFIVPISVALQLLITAAYLGFVYACIRLRRELAAPAALDWLFVFSFFGFAFKWGFLTFQVAAPLGLAFIFLSARHARLPSLRRGLAIALLGAVLLVCHALVFLYALVVGMAMVCIAGSGWRPRIRRATPYVGLIVLCAAYSLMRGIADARYGIPATVPAVNWHFGIRHELLYFSFGTGWTPIYAITCAAAILAPWLAGFRIEWRLSLRTMPLAVILLVLLFVPSFAMETSLLYQRFALFLFPAYALAFGARRERSMPGAIPLLALSCAAVLAANAGWAWASRQDGADFLAVSAELLPGQRALALIKDPGTRGDPTPNFNPNVHYASWYQAERQGLVDMNFAIAPPQIVRFRPEHTPAVKLNFAWQPSSFDWQTHHGEIYRYFFVRRDTSQPATMFSGLRCAPALLKASGSWEVYEAKRCPPSTATAR